jgi:ADP-ribose pyrophosphatase YjhB (NUDIX family)
VKDGGGSAIGQRDIFSLNKNGERTMTKHPYTVLQSTGTILGVHHQFPWLVAFTKNAPEKHNGRHTLPGGRQQDETFMQVLRREFRDEAGGEQARLGRIRIIAVALDRYRDVRQKTFGYVSEGRCQDGLADVVAPFSYGCPDYVGFAPIYGVPAPNNAVATDDGQSERMEKVEFLDVHPMRFTVDPAQSFLAAGHDVIVDVYRRLILPKVLARPGDWIVDEPSDPESLTSVISDALIIHNFEQYRLEHFIS